MAVNAEYLIQGEGESRVRDQVDWVPEFSRRARGFAVYAALRSLGRRGVVELVERCCAQARRFAARIGELPGVEVLNEVVLNQVLFRFEDDARTDAVLARVQQSGRVWMSGTTGPVARPSEFPSRTGRPATQRPISRSTRSDGSPQIDRGDQARVQLRLTARVGQAVDLLLDVVQLRVAVSRQSRVFLERTSEALEPPQAARRSSRRPDRSPNALCGSGSPPRWPHRRTRTRARAGRRRDAPAGR